MNTVVIEIKDPKAMELLKDMEEKKWIRIEESSEGSKPSARLAGKLSVEAANYLQQHTSLARKEWDKDI